LITFSGINTSLPEYSSKLFSQAGKNDDGKKKEEKKKSIHLGSRDCRDQQEKMKALIRALVALMSCVLVLVGILLPLITELQSLLAQRRLPSVIINIPDSLSLPSFFFFFFFLSFPSVDRVTRLIFQVLIHLLVLSFAGNIYVCSLLVVLAVSDFHWFLDARTPEYIFLLFPAPGSRSFSPRARH